MIDTSRVTRVELIDETGRAYTRWNTAAFVQLQDDNRTLKIFVSEGDKTERG